MFMGLRVTFVSKSFVLGEAQEYCCTCIQPLLVLLVGTPRNSWHRLVQRTAYSYTARFVVARLRSRAYTRQKDFAVMG